MEAAAPAMPVNPNTAAISAMTRNINDHLSMNYATTESTCRNKEFFSEAK